MQELLYWVWFANAVFSYNKSARQLFDAVGSPYEIYRMKEKDFKNYPFLSENTIHNLMNKELAKADNIVEICQAEGYDILTCEASEFPSPLKNIDDCPYVLYHRGLNFDFDSILAIGVVGTRKPSGYGAEVARRFGRDLANNGAVVVSGMAMGVDSIAARGAISVKKPTVAVLGTAIDHPSPVSSRDVYEYCLSDGAVYSEYGPGSKYYATNFPYRNRLISGLSKGVLVVEAPLKSGSMITAEHAISQGRDIFAVPNVITNESGMGANKLIKEGAKSVTEVQDILEEYSFMFEHYNEIEEYDSGASNAIFQCEDFLSGFDNLAPLELETAKQMTDKPVTVDEIASKAELPVPVVMSALTMLEIKKVVKSEPGKLYRLNLRGDNFGG